LYWEDIPASEFCFGLVHRR
jgi:hypothetical protein